MNLSIKLENAAGEYTLYLQGEIDAFTAQQLREKLIPLVQQGADTTITVDLQDVSYMDSTGIGIFVGALKTSAQSGSKLVLINIPSRIERLFRITGLFELITTHAQAEGEAQ